MRTAFQHYTLGRREDIRRRAVLDRDWFTVGYMDAKLHRTFPPFKSDDPRLAEWERGYRDAGGGMREGA